MNREGATEEEQQILDEVEELAERLGLSVEVAFSLLNRVRIEKILGRQAAIDNDIIDIHREVIPDADSKVPIKPSRSGNLFSRFSFGRSYSSWEWSWGAWCFEGATYQTRRSHGRGHRQVP